MNALLEDLIAGVITGVAEFVFGLGKFVLTLSGRKPDIFSAAMVGLAIFTVVGLLVYHLAR